MYRLFIALVVAFACLAPATYAYADCGCGLGSKAVTVGKKAVKFVSKVAGVQRRQARREARRSR